ncbi:hypothetical protein [Lutimonas zeaxanthinifaciens]|uniref:hypothetical protein n=1 Tax=Lutimonas zeaxanthinifaciens TaxID=3060215 RepID=UPI00265C91F2|nr:hypothetical protein [Lutimonas sp. YSD2104]WKK66343.1 hypothetical protein QZH61_01685 [Lutimonas sp. YSD2104]
MIKWIIIINELLIQNTLGYGSDNETLSLKSKSLTELVTIGLLSITTLLVVLTPLFIIYLWIVYSKIYVNKYRRIFSLKKWITRKSNLDIRKLDDKFLASYRKEYSLMVGFGISFIAYVLSSLRFIHLKFETLGQGIKEYFEFPFVVIDELGFVETPADSVLNFEEFWSHMLLIVVITGLFFLTGYLIGSMIVDYRIKNLRNKSDKNLNQIKLVQDSFELISWKKEQAVKPELEEADYF